MKNAPNSKSNLDRALQRFAGDFARANELRGLMANAIVAQIIGDGVVKGGSGLRFRYGEKFTRVTMDLDTAWKTDLNVFLKLLEERLAAGWNGFSGEVRMLAPAKPRGIPFDYVMQPCDVKLKYLGIPWFTVQLEYQIAQKLHGASAPSSKRAHDLIDLQLIMANGGIDMELASELCRKLFKYRQRQAWPPEIVKGDTWDAAYDGQRRNLPVLPTVDEAVAWANELIAKIDNA